MNQTPYCIMTNCKIITILHSVYVSSSKTAQPVFGCQGCTRQGQPQGARPWLHHAAPPAEGTEPRDETSVSPWALFLVPTQQHGGTCPLALLGGMQEHCGVAVPDRLVCASWVGSSSHHPSCQRITAGTIPLPAGSPSLGIKWLIGLMCFEDERHKV